jgi:hypothetical protein
MLLRHALLTKTTSYCINTGIFPAEYNSYVSEKPHVKGNRVGWIQFFIRNIVNDRRGVVFKCD